MLRPISAKIETFKFVPAYGSYSTTTNTPPITLILSSSTGDLSS
jgi:hypothetical protein